MPPLSDLGGLRTPPDLRGPAVADDWFAQQGAPGMTAPVGGGAAGIMAPRQSAEDKRLLQDPAFTKSYHDWVMAQGPGAADWATPTGYQQWLQQQGAPGMTAPGAPGPGMVRPDAGTAPPGNPTDRNYVRSQLENWYRSQGLTPTGRGTGPTDIEYYTDQILATGGWTDRTGKGENNIGYWTSRIPQDIAQARGGGGGAPAGAPGGYGMLSGGTGDLTQIAAKALETSPGFQFRLGEGLKALERSAAARGTLLTGGTLKGLNRYAQDYASNEYGNQYARLMGEQGTRYNQLYGLSQLGLNAAGQQAGLGSAYGGLAGNLLSNQAGQLGNALTGQGNAAAAGTIGASNAWNQGIGNMSNLAQQYLLWQLMSGGGGGGQAARQQAYWDAGNTGPVR